MYFFVGKDNNSMLAAKFNEDVILLSRDERYDVLLYCFSYLFLV